jgi:hypothetical protein
MLNGKLGIERADNGWILTWFESRKDFTTTVESSREVFTDATACLQRVAEVVGMVSGQAAARALDAAIQAVAHHDSAGFNPAVDPDVAELMPDHAPSTAYAGD